MSNAEEIASKNAVSYVKKHNFDEELLDFARACYYDGFMDAQAHTNQTLQELKANVKSINKEIDSAIKSQKEADREVPEWLKGQSHAYNAVLTLIDEAINE